MNKIKRKHFLVVSDAGVMDKASKILEIKNGSTLCYSENDKMWKDTKSFGTIELVPGWRPGKKVIMEARIRVATLKSKNCLVNLEALIAKLKQFKRLVQNSAFMPSLKETILKSYYDKNFNIWVDNYIAYPKYEDFCLWSDIDHSLGSKIRERKEEVRICINSISEKFHSSEKSKRHCRLLAGAAAGGTAFGAYALAAAVLKKMNKLNKKEK